MLFKFYIEFKLYIIFVTVFSKLNIYNMLLDVVSI